MVYISEDLPWSVEDDDGTSNFNQAAYVNIGNSGSSIRLLVVYRSPNSSQQNNSALNDLLSRVTVNTVVVGDFNYPNINWENHSASDPLGRAFLDVCDEHLYGGSR